MEPLGFLDVEYLEKVIEDVECKSVSYGNAESTEASERRGRGVSNFKRDKEAILHMDIPPNGLAL